MKRIINFLIYSSYSILNLFFIKSQIFGKEDVDIATNDNKPTQFTNYISTQRIFIQKITAFILVAYYLIAGNIIHAKPTIIDIELTEIISPNLTVANCLTSAPKVMISNLSSSNQPTPFIVNFVITGPVAYSSSRIDTIGAGQSRVIIFDSTFVPSPGNYTATSFISTKADSNQVNDTLIRTFTVIENHVGGLNDLYFYFANSSPCAFNSGYSFEWVDTTGSTNLILNSQVDSSIYKFTGSINDGYFSVGNVLPQGLFFKFFYIEYDSFFISTNGIIAMTAKNNSAKLLDPNPDSIPSTSNPGASIFALWKDLNFGYTLTGSNRLCFKIDYNTASLVITFDRAPDNFATTSEDYVSFQIILELFSGYPTGNFFAIQYDYSKSGSGFLNKYFMNSLSAHSVGIQDSYGTIGIEYRRVSENSLSPQLITAGPLFESSVRITFGGPLFPFPVELSSFNASVGRQDVLLSWSTVSEYNNSGFNVERSGYEGQISESWSEIGFVYGNGTTNEPKSYSFSDRDLIAGRYNYRLKQIDFNGNFEYFNLSEVVEISNPIQYNLSQNFPNPFNPLTKINFEIPAESFVSLKVFDLAGKEVAKIVNEIKQAGYYTIDFNGSDLSSGIYFYKIESGSFIRTLKMVVLK